MVIDRPITDLFTLEALSFDEGAINGGDVDGMSDVSAALVLLLFCRFALARMRRTRATVALTSGAGLLLRGSAEFSSDALACLCFLGDCESEEE